MRPENEEYVQGWWAGVFGVERDAVWSTVSVRPHGILGDYAGFFIAWRDRGVHVSAPAEASAALERDVSGRPLAQLQDVDFWHSVAAAYGVDTIGPSTHHYLDVDHGPNPDVVTPTGDELASLQERSGDADWRESGFADTSLRFGLRQDGELVAASNLNLFDRLPRDIGILVAPEARGRGLAAAVGRHAASYAVREHGLARWGARNTNLASLATARRLGFEPFCTQLALRRS